MPGGIGQNPQYPGVTIFPEDQNTAGSSIDPNGPGAQAPPVMWQADLDIEFMQAAWVGNQPRLNTQLRLPEFDITVGGDLPGGNV